MRKGVTGWTRDERRMNESYLESFFGRYVVMPK
jgi:hypothetical protein